jgi:hypothetical protein
MAKKNVVGPKGARLLRRVARHILAEPLRYEQNEIICKLQPTDRTYMGRKLPLCRTVACIGGWLELLGGRRRRPGPGEALSYSWGARKLGVTTEQYGDLVQYTDQDHPHYGWPDQFAARYNRAKSPLAKVRIANERIEHFIRTGE